jgi:CRP-like cAMP-binding protein
MQHGPRLGAANGTATANRAYGVNTPSRYDGDRREVSGGQIDPLEDVSDNLLLAALSAAELNRLMPHLHPCCLTPGTTLLEPGKPIQRVYFIKKGVVSRMLTSVEGCDVEVSITGREGIIGAEVIAGHGLGQCRAIVQLGGRGWWIPARVLKEEFSRGGALKELLLQYVYAQLRQSGQVALCNRLHTIESRLCSWLLMYRDRIETDDLYLSQDQIAHSLGVRRASVTVVAGDLRQKGLIDYARGHLTVLNRDGLKERACECYDHSTRQGQYVPPHECMLQMA